MDQQYHIQALEVFCSKSLHLHFNCKFLGNEGFLESSLSSVSLKFYCSTFHSWIFEQKFQMKRFQLVRLPIGTFPLLTIGRKFLGSVTKL